MIKARNMKLTLSAVIGHLDWDRSNGDETHSATSCDSCTARLILPHETQPESFFGQHATAMVRIQTSDNLCRNNWPEADSTVGTLSAEIGYGNAAGLLFRKGLTGPPPAHIEELPDDKDANASESTVNADGMPSRPFITVRPENTGATCLNDTPSSSTSAAKSATARLGVQPGERHPITALDSRKGDDPNEVLKEMTPEEKEREAERLFVLFDRMDKNPIISAGTEERAEGQTPNASSSSAPGGSGARKTMMQTMREKLEKGEVDQWERKDEEEERKRLEEEEKREEEEAKRDLAAYKKRLGRA